MWLEPFVQSSEKKHKDLGKPLGSLSDPDLHGPSFISHMDSDSGTLFTI